jgi:hypothetical protein
MPNGTPTASYAEKVEQVYDAGFEDSEENISYWNEQLEQTLYSVDTGGKSFYDEFWDVYQESGARRSYQYTFSARGWTDDTFKPKYDIILGAGYTATYMFWECYCTDIAATLERQGVKLDTTLCGYMHNMFQNAKTKRVPELNCSHAMDYSTNGLNYTFANS